MVTDCEVSEEVAKGYLVGAINGPTSQLLENRLSHVLGSQLSLDGTIPTRD